jgi:hypothetical protein
MEFYYCRPISFVQQGKLNLSTVPTHLSLHICSAYNRKVQQGVTLLTSVLEITFQFLRIVHIISG